MQSDCAQEGRFLRWLWVADGFFLSACFRVSSDRNGAIRRSRSDGRVAGSLPVLVGKSLAVVVVSATLLESELETQASRQLTHGNSNCHLPQSPYIMLALVHIMPALCLMLALADYALA